MPAKKKEDKVEKFVEANLAEHERWLSQHKPPNLGDNDVNTEYVAEYHRILAKRDILNVIKALM
jgi:hypothetical protein